MDANLQSASSPTKFDLILPHQFEPRNYQLPALRALDSGIKRAVAVWHRRAGKEKTFLNHTVKAAFQRIGTYFYIFPTYAQGKKILWQGMDRDGFPFMAHIPEAIRKKKLEDEMRVELINGSAFQIIGSDKIDSIVGTNPVGCVFSEYSLQDPRAWDYLRPILRENGGWAIFDFTPRGKNHGYQIYQMAKDNPEWFCQMLTIDDTGVMNDADIDAERRAGMSEEMIQQEFYCSFEGVMFGAYFGNEMRQVEAEGRITRVPYEPGIGVETWWDLGINDSMTIWFTQTIGREVRVIDYYESSGEGLAHYAKYLQGLPYIYGAHHAPHDIEVRELGTGRSRREVAREYGINFDVVPNLPLEDGIEAARTFLGRCWFDKEKCERGINALRSYRKDYDEKNEVFKARPVHDWASHGADAFRYLAVGHKIAVKQRAEKVEVVQYKAGSESIAWMGM